MIEKTLAIIKPDAVKRKVVGKIIDRIESESFRILEMKMVYLTKDGAKGFYAVHQNKPFFETLTDFMSSGEIVVMVLEGKMPFPIGAWSWEKPTPIGPSPKLCARPLGFQSNRTPFMDQTVNRPQKLKFNIFSKNSHLSELYLAFFPLPQHVELESISPLNAVGDSA